MPATSYMYLHTVAGGHLRYTLELVRALQEIWPTTLICSRGTQAEDLDASQILSSIDETARGVSRILDRATIYRRHLDETDHHLTQSTAGIAPRVIHFQELPTLHATRMIKLASARGLKTVVTVHNATPHIKTLQGRLIQRDAIQAWDRADALIVHSQSIRDLLAAQLPSARIFVVPHPIWPAALTPPTAPQVQFLFFGTLRENKGIFRFLDALEELGDPTASIVGAGASQMVNAISSGLAKRGLINCDFIPGYFPEDSVTELFTRHRVVVAPYEHFDAQSGVTHLAIGHRRPVVVTDAGGLGDPVRAYGVGAVVPRDGTGLAKAMANVASADRAGAFAHPMERAIAELAMGNVATMTSQVYNEALHS